MVSSTALICALTVLSMLMLRRNRKKTRGGEQRLRQREAERDAGSGNRQGSASGRRAPNRGVEERLSIVSQGRLGMIKLTRLNGEVMYLSIFQILYMEKIPETKVKLANGDYYLVRDSVEEVNEQIRAFLSGCLSPEKSVAVMKNSPNNIG